MNHNLDINAGEAIEKRKLAVASIRRSSYNQEGNQSFEIQKLAIQDYAEKKNYHLPEEFIFVDDAVSAYRTLASQRNGLNEMKKVVLAEDIHAIIFYDFSRIDRRIYSFVSEFYYDVISKKPDMKFFTTTKEDAWKPSDIDVKLQLIFANAESNEKSRRAVDAQIKDLHTAQKRPGSVVPYGYVQEEKQLIPSEQAHNVLFIFHLAAWGHSLQKITNTLNEANIPSPTNKQWRTSTVENILKNPVYKGTLNWSFKRKMKENQEYVLSHTHPALVPEIMYQMIELNRNLKKVYNKFDTPFLFSGILKCEECNELLQHRNASTKKNNVKYIYMKYQCTNCNYEIEAQSFTKVVLKKIDEQFSMALKVNSRYIKSLLDDYLFRLNSQRENLNNKLQLILANEKYVSEYQSLNLSSVFRNTKQKFNNQISELDNAMIKLKKIQCQSEIDFFIEYFKSLKLSSLSAVEQRLILLYFLKEIQINYTQKDSLEFSIQFKANPIAFISESIG
ncbi:recombinase family protein [Bacillus zanthoxyli]|nr:recombinase family protein [Bacillus zanthoxyli]